MKAYFKTALKFTKNIASTGALVETSRWIEKEITSFVDPSRRQVIIEYGAGHGNISRAILAAMHQDSELFAFELNSDFCEVLRRIPDERLKVVNLSAQFVDEVVPEKESVDCIISSIPFSFIPDPILDDILDKSCSLLKDGSYMTQVLFSARHLKLFKKHFSQCSAKLVMNFPPAHVYFAKK